MPEYDYELEYDPQKLKDILEHIDMTQVELALMLHINKRTVCLKINGKVDWTLSEAIKICNILRIDDLNYIFTKKKEQTD